MRSKLFAFIVFFLWVVPCFAIEVAGIAWERQYDGLVNDVDSASAIAVDDTGNVYVTGKSMGSGTDFDYATIKYRSNGDTVWVSRYNGPGNSIDVALAMAVDTSGNIYVTGKSYGSGTNYDYATIKYYPNGDTAWVRRYNGPPGDSIDFAIDIAVDDSGNVYVTGESVGSGTTDDYATIKYRPNGDTAWVRRYNGPGNSWDAAYAIALDSAGNAYVTGWSWGGGGVNYDYTTTKYLSNGDTAWVRRYNGPGNGSDLAHDIAVDDSGNVYVTGYSQGSSTSNDYATVKYYPNGDTAWVRRYNGPGNGNDLAYGITVDNSGNVYITGHSAGVGTGDDFATIKYFVNGDTAWVRRYNGPGNGFDGANAIAVDDSGNVYVTGESFGMGTGNDYATVKYRSNGDMAWVIRYNNGLDQANSLILDDSYNIYVTGVISPGADDYATIKYVKIDSIPFAQAVNYGAGDSPYSVFCADLDGDGDLDLAVANVITGSDTVSILKNNGDGTFQSAVNYDAGDSPYSVFCADLDGDNDLDLAVTNQNSDSVSILKNNGDGTFQSAVNYGTGGGYYSVFCADLDGDDDIDLAVTANSGVAILKNNGDGTFQSAVNYVAGIILNSIFCADLDRDNDLDLAVGDLAEGVYVLKNNGNGTFQNAVHYETGSRSYSVFCADLNGDDNLDLEVASEIGVSILMNNGNGTFQNAVYYEIGNHFRSYSVFCADLNGDGDLDLAMAGYSYVHILKNNGDGTFQHVIIYSVASCPYFVFCADLDRDGDQDLVASDVCGHNVSISENLTQVPANQTPWAFSLISPTDQDTIFSSATFHWYIPYDPNFGDQFRYDLYVSTSPGFEPLYTTIDSNLCISKYTAVLDTGTYYWKVKAKDNWGAERWSTQTWSFDVAYLTDTLRVYAFSPVDLIVTDPMGNFIRLDSNTILGATYDTSTDYNHDGDKDDIVTIPNRLAGDNSIEVVAEPGESGEPYDLGIRIDGTDVAMLAMNQPAPAPGEVDTFSYIAPACLNGDLTGDLQIALGDVVYLITYLYKSGPAPDPIERGDVNSDGIVALGDVVYLITYLYKGGAPPPCWQ